MLIRRLTRLTPQRVRLIVVLLELTLLTLIWLSYLFTSRSLEENFERSTIQTLTSETTVLEDHMDRSFGLTKNLLTTIGEMTKIMKVSPDKLPSDEIRSLLGDTRLIRNLSLLSTDGRVLTSSNPSNTNLQINLDKLLGGKTSSSWTTDQIKFGPVLPFRNLQEFSRQQTSPTQEFMAAVYEVTHNGIRFYWVATINISLFRNLWHRINQNPEVELAIFSHSGERILSHQPHAELSTNRFEPLKDALRTSDIGHFYLDANHEFLVVYRAKSTLPIVLTSIANMQRLDSTVPRAKRYLLTLAITGSALLTLILLGAYRLYLRHERVTAYSERLLDGITTHVMMSRSDKQGRIEDVNQPLLDATGYSREELIGKPYSIFKSGLETQEFYINLWQTIDQGKIWHGTLRNKTKSGQILWLDATIIPLQNEWMQTTNYGVMYSDITKAIQASQDYEKERTARQALETLNQKLLTDLTRDPLTGVSNRRGLDQFLDEIQGTDILSRMSISVLMLDIDFFKQINDTWGHAAGDIVLRQLATLWQSKIRVSDLLVRLGGEEFAIVLLKAELRTAMEIAEEIRSETANNVIDTAGLSEPLKVTVSIGVAFSAHASDESIDSLLKRADDALYLAKESGRNQIKLARKVTAAS